MFTTRQSAIGLESDSKKTCKPSRDSNCTKKYLSYSVCTVDLTISKSFVSRKIRSLTLLYKATIVGNNFVVVFSGPEKQKLRQSQKIEIKSQVVLAPANTYCQQYYKNVLIVFATNAAGMAHFRHWHKQGKLTQCTRESQHRLRSNLLDDYAHK